jgi:mono/diheme cytochrome c family protein
MDRNKNESKNEIRGLKLILFSSSVFSLLLFLPKHAIAQSGKDIFLKYKCNKCHTIKAQNIEPILKEEKGEEEEEEKGEKGKKKITDLSGVGLKRNAEWIKGYLLKKEKNEEGKKHKPKWKGTNDELKTVSEWLAQQKTKIDESEIKKWLEEIMKKSK